jgi:phosphoribosylaminoimidazolecarboxamide formyltransferase/IMP cyclohydrolase
MRALLSVTDKTGLVELGTALCDLGWSLLATGGSARTLSEAGLPVTPTDEWTGSPELYDGRVKTLHYRVFAALLGRRDRPGHTADAAQYGVAHIDLVACNFYPFAERAAAGQDLDLLLDSIDVGGPAMVRAAAKNHPWVLPLVDPLDYAPVVDSLREADGEPSGVPLELRRELAVKAFRYTCAFDDEIARTLARGEPVGATTSGTV